MEGRSPSRPSFGVEIARRIVELHGGTIAIDYDEQQNRRTNIMLPSEPEPVHAHVPAQSSSNAFEMSSFEPQRRFLSKMLTAIVALAQLGTLFVLSGHPRSWLGWVSAGLIIVNSRVRSGKIQAGSLFAGIMSIALLHWWRPHAVMGILFGFCSILGAALAVAGSRHRKVVALLSASTAIFFTSCMEALWPILIGAAGGAWLILLSFAGALAPIARWAGGWFGGVLLIGISLAVFASAAVCHVAIFGAVTGLASITRAELEPYLLRTLASKATPSVLFDTLSKMSMRMPMVDLDLLTDSERASVSPREAFSRRAPADVQEGRENLGAPRAPIIYNFPASFWRTVHLSRVCERTECLSLLMSVPGDGALRIASRQVAQSIVPLIVLQLVLCGIPAFFLHSTRHGCR